jgi:ribonucleoside-diphosphate reductase alpha chain
MVDHPNIKTTTSLVDFVFRALAFEYLGRTDLVHVIDKPEVSNLGDDDAAEIIGRPSLSNLHVKSVTSTPSARVQKQKKATAHVHAEAPMDAANAAAKNMQSDAPSCNVCGHITVRSGTCYKCLNCGNSLGCS